jgi:small subunit ribosomal protein S20
MPHTKSAKKHLRQSAKRRERNREAKKAIRLQMKKLFRAPKDTTVEQLQKEFDQASKKLDKAAAKRVIHPNTAARRKARLARLINARRAPGAK